LNNIIQLDMGEGKYLLQHRLG